MYKILKVRTAEWMDECMELRKKCIKSIIVREKERKRKKNAYAYH